LGFDYRGLGESEGARGRLIPVEEVEDIHSATTFLATLPEVDGTQLGLFGDSHGGSHVACGATIDRRANCVVTFGAIGDFDRWC
jgi:cephalosporin-C deacetylase-like acetyl esterase